MAETEIRYGLILKDKDRILGMEKESNEGKDFCGDFTYRLSEWSDEPWLLKDFNRVVMAKWSSEVWYNSNYENPVNPYHPLELDIVKVVTITVVKESSLSDEIDTVNELLRQEGYASIDKADYLEEESQ